MANAERTTAEYWGHFYDLGQEYQWGGIAAHRLAEHIWAEWQSRHPPQKRRKTSSREPQPSTALRVLVAGAGTSMDGPAIRKTFGLPAENVIGADFVTVNVDFQTSHGVTGVQQDMLQHRDDWAQAFDVVVDASFVDVFTSYWSGRPGIKLSASAKTALRNLWSYVKPGGMLVVKSAISTEEQYGQLVQSALKMDYSPEATLDTSDMRRLAESDSAAPVSAAPVKTTRSGRPVSAHTRHCEGHVGIVWKEAAAGDSASKKKKQQKNATVSSRKRSRDSTDA